MLTPRPHLSVSFYLLCRMYPGGHFFSVFCLTLEGLPSRTKNNNRLKGVFLAFNCCLLEHSTALDRSGRSARPLCESFPNGARGNQCDLVWSFVFIDMCMGQRWAIEEMVVSVYLLGRFCRLRNWGQSVIKLNLTERHHSGSELRYVLLVPLEL